MLGVPVNQLVIAKIFVLTVERPGTGRRLQSILAVAFCTFDGTLEFRATDDCATDMD